VSLYKRLHDVQAAPATGNKRRDPVLDELRQKIHHHLIDELGPILYDKRLSEDDLRRRVNDHLHAALAMSGYEPVATPLDEFTKAGGSAKCLTLRLDGEEAASWKSTQ